MPDPVTNLFQTTLLVLYFVTPATTVELNSKHPKSDYEKTKLWTLQSTSQIPTENPTMCQANGFLLQQKFEQVSTVTIRLYCLCPEKSTNTDDICDKAKKETTKNFTQGNFVPPAAAVVPIGPNTQMPLSFVPPKQ
jgi:hypothetical protein